MEVNALTRFISVGKDLSLLRKLESELDNLEQEVNKGGLASTLKDPNLQRVRKYLEAQGWEVDRAGSFRRKPVPRLKVPSPWKKEFIYRFLRRFGKGFLIGWGGKSILDLLFTIIKSKGNIKKIIETLQNCIQGEPIRYGAFIAWLLACFESIMRLTQQFHFLSNHTRPLLAGLLSGTALWLLPPNLRMGMAIFVFVRAFEIIVMMGVENNILPKFEHGDALLMSLASAQMGWCFINYPETIEPGYRKFLLHQAGLPGVFLAVFKEVNSAPPFSSAISILTPLTLQAINEIRKKQGFPLYNNIPNPRAFHDIIHPQTSFCTINFLQLVFQGIKRAIPVYVPVHVLPLLLFKGSKIFSQPLHLGFDALYNIIRSSLFLSSYVAMAWYGPCLTNSIFERRGSWTPAFAGFLAGLMVLIEKKTRRVELALYVMSQAVYGFFQYWFVKRGVFPVIPHGSVLVFSLSTAVMLHAYINNPLLLRRTYFSIIKFCFGSGAGLLGFPVIQTSPSSYNVASMSNHQSSPPSSPPSSPDPRNSHS